MKIAGRIFSILLICAIIVTYMPGFALTAMAETGSKGNEDTPEEFGLKR